MIKFIDFAPKAQTKRGLLFQTIEVADFASAVEEANHWLTQNRVKLIAIETVVLPEMHDEDGTTDTKLRTSGEHSSCWYQFIRVWYQE